ncbi:hypothetical protein LUZ63_023110 [Rhynchospora breviuscula]|uniref:Glutamate-ammonia-ligase adenylyltransferase n=1 Tax=Rhynchospora breviuscula TaxID=2022672 RepID=A0A9P9Z3K6_9POAL|nr:hypothetical protein LUZ63_023110 [Rhynchospora breviuscula]
MALAQRVADPDRALASLVQIARRDADAVRRASGDAGSWRALWDIVGASDGFAEFYLRHPDEIAHLAGAGLTVPDEQTMRAELLASVGDVDGFAADGTDAAWVALRISYRRLLARIAAYDLGQDDPATAIDVVSAALADLAGAALEASLSVARTRVSGTGPAAFPREQVAATRFAIIAMGKTGARELNYVSDVDVIFVGGSADEETVSEARAIDIGTRLAVQTMRGISGPEIEPPLWEVDPNLRPEGKQGALVRSLGAHQQYYARWAKSWEFQALLKARAIAGDAALGAEYIAAVQPLVWHSAARENFVDGVQRMRERVTDNIPAAEINRQVKLGPGGIRDVEFTVQLLQLVHGLTDERIRQRGSLEALDALVAEGYIGRSEAEAFGRDYRLLRLIEHRLQLRGLRRTALLPEKDDDLRVLARATRLADSAAGLQTAWESIKREVRDIHVRLFYRPLLSAVAALPEGERTLSTEQARDRLAAIGFRDPAGALRHIAALTSGLSRKATIQRHLMPIMMIRWFADGVDPDYGLLVFRRISERLGNTPWFLRMLRDSAGAAESLTRVLSGSRYIGELMEWIPESVAWLDDDALLRPRTGAALQEEARAIQTRWDDIDGAMRSVRALRRREMLRVAMAAVLEVVSLEQLSDALSTITEVTIQATLRAVRREVVPPEDDALDFSVIAMGRFGGREIGFGSDADVMYVYRANGVDPQRAGALALKIVAGLREHSEDHRLPLDLDADLRPEGRSGPLARSLDAYAEYYRRWSLSWEAQALLRARGVAGSVKLIQDFIALADDVRYPAVADPNGLREIRRIKARVENERLPQGADPARHLKLGPGSISDVEWLVQILQLQHARAIPALRTTSTLGALDAAREAGLTSDVLPADRGRLDGIGRILEYPPHSATQVEEDYLGATRRARRVFEKLFYG